MKYSFTNKEEQKEALREFLDAQGEWEHEYRTGHTDSVDEWLYYFVTEAKRSIKEIKSEYRNEDLAALIEEYEGQLTPSQIRKALVDAASMQACGITIEENILFQQPVGECERQVSGMSGEVNGQQVNCVLSALTEGLSLDEKKKVARSLDEAYWNPEGYCADCIYVNCDYDCWAAVVDLDKAKENLDAALSEKKKA
jgi:hypothetical protein